MNMELGHKQKDWLAMLESGGHKQTTESLCQEDPEGHRHYCCLGLACLVIGERFLSSPTQGLTGLRKLFTKASGWATYIMEFERIGLRSKAGCFDHGDLSEPLSTWFPGIDLEGLDPQFISIARINDSGKASFKQIAQFIRANTDLLFTHSI